MKHIFYLFFLGIFYVSSVQAETSRYDFDHGSVELVALEQGLGLHFKLNEHWHIYWKNSGDSGAAPKWKWTIPANKIITEHWPVPSRLPVEGIINFGYEKEALIAFLLEKPLAISPMKPLVQVDLEFLACKVECIPYFTTLNLHSDDLRLAPQNQVLKQQFIYPKTLEERVSWKFLQQQENILFTNLELPQSLNKNLKNIRVFPFDSVLFQSKSAVIQPLTESKYSVALDLQNSSSRNFKGSNFLLVLENQNNDVVAFEQKITKIETPILLILLFAFIGGVILNFMPCVFPVLTIKAMSFLQPQTHLHQLRMSGWFYALGVVASFLLLGGLLVFLRASGEEIGWGFQLQSPVFASAIAILFFWLALNFLGLFEIGQSISGLGGKKTSSGYMGSFFTGVLATIVATPCTAPFMGVALGASLTLPTHYTFFIFTGLGIGMASPFLLMAYFAHSIQYLLKPGAWMQKLKEFLAFPMFLTVLWLIWVLSQQTEPQGVFLLLGLFILIGFWVWALKVFFLEKNQQRLLMAGFLLSIFSIKYLPIDSIKVVDRDKPSSSSWQNFSQRDLDASLDKGEAVFIDFTAAWCITCQVNKKVVLNTSEIQKLFQEKNVTLFKADWTNNDPKITKALAQYGRNSLPLYVYYTNNSRKPKILPELLTKNIVKELFNREK